MAVILLMGGSKSGKSLLAQDVARTLAKDGPLWYVATMIPRDAEDHARITRHLQERAGLEFTTWEQGRDIAAVTEAANGCGTYLVDSVTALLANEMFADSVINEDAAESVSAGLELLAEKLENVVFVCDDLFSLGSDYDETTLVYLRGLAKIGRRLAAVSDCVAEVVAGIPLIYKGSLPSL